MPTIIKPIQVNSDNPIEDRLCLSKLDMLAANDDLYPNKYLCLCTDDSRIYIYNYYNDPDRFTGKFRPLEQYLAFDTADAAANLNSILNSSELADTVTDINTSVTTLSNNVGALDDRVGTLESKAHVHGNIATLNGITSTTIARWDSASTTANNLKDTVGQSTDGTTANTVYGRLAAVNAKIGSPEDPMGLNTVYGRMNGLASDFTRDISDINALATSTAGRLTNDVEPAVARSLKAIDLNDQIVPMSDDQPEYGRTAIIRLKSINGESIVGSGDIEVESRMGENFTTSKAVGNLPAGSSIPASMSAVELLKLILAGSQPEPPEPGSSYLYYGGVNTTPTSISDLSGLPRMEKSDEELIGHTINLQISTAGQYSVVACKTGIALTRWYSTNAPTLPDVRFTKVVVDGYNIYINSQQTFVSNYPYSLVFTAEN